MQYPKSAAAVHNIRINTCNTYESLSRELRVSTSSLFYWEAGKKLPSLTSIKKLLDYAKKKKIKVKVQDFLEEC
jgi:DNA-binding transcriptional regulator YiaG